MSALPKVLVVEDDDGIRGLLVTALRREALYVDAADDGAQALRLCANCEYAVIILDLMMPIVDGFEFLEAFEKTTPPARSVIFVVTAFDDRLIGNLRSPKVHAIVKKPFDVQQLVATVREVALVWTSEAQPRAITAAPLDMRPPAEPC